MNLTAKKTTAEKPKNGLKLDILKNKLISVSNSADFAARGQEIVRERNVSLGPFPAVPYKIDWEQNPLKNRSWQWRWGSLSALGYLIAHHVQDENPDALDDGFSLIDSWHQSFFNTKPGDAGLAEFVWHDHGTALRAEHILWFYTHALGYPNKKFDGNLIKIIALLEKHAEALAEPDFYSKHTNHGLEQARVLLLLATVGEGVWKRAKLWQQVAVERISSELDFAFTDEGVHVENSPAYHVFVFKVFISIINDYDENHSGPLYLSIQEKSKKILEYVTHIIRPDGYLPIIGDTEKLRPTDSFQSILGQTPEYKQFLYSRSQGKTGSRPRETYKVYPQSGYVIYRNRWGVEKDFHKSLHAVLKGGALSQYHRQQDEGNIVLHALGEDWLIDAGMYNYNNTDPIRAYARSRRAHNVAIISDARYKAWDDIKSSWSLKEIESSENKKEVEFLFSGLENVELKRSVIFGGLSLTTTDSALLSNGIAKSMQILWHVDRKKSVHIISNNEIYIRSTQSGRVLKLIVESTGPISTTVRSGQKDSKIAALTSDIANSAHSAQVITIATDPFAEHEVKSVFSFIPKDEFENIMASIK